MRVFRKNRIIGSHTRLTYILVIVVLFCNGCNSPRQGQEILKVGHKTEEVLDVSFESVKGFELFINGSTKELKRSGLIASDQKQFETPTVMVWSQTNIESQNSVINDELKKCDADGNLIITDEEAKAYYENVKQKSEGG